MIYSTLQISQLTDSKLIGNPDILISNISFDSRNLYSISDTAFIAINTKNNSGEKYISSVVEKGVKVIISEKLNSFSCFVYSFVSFVNLFKNPFGVVGISSPNTSLPLSIINSDIL